MATLQTHVDNINRWFFNTSESADSGAGSSPLSGEEPTTETRDDSGAESDDPQDVRRQAWQTTMHRFFNHTDYDLPQKYTGSMGSDGRDNNPQQQQQQQARTISVIVSDARPNRSTSSGIISPAGSSTGTSTDSGNECSEKEINISPNNLPALDQVPGEKHDPEKSEECPVPSKKMKKQTPDESKDEAYWERRRKNNQAAKKSRDIRRQKEMHVLQRHKELEDTNEDLRKSLSSLKEKNDLLQETLLTYRTLLIKHGFELP